MHTSQNRSASSGNGFQDGKGMFVAAFNLAAARQLTGLRCATLRRDKWPAPPGQVAQDVQSCLLIAGHSAAVGP
jgi:hypothetical protein